MEFYLHTEKDFMYLGKYTWMPILERRYYMKHNKIKKSTFDFSAQPPDFSLQNVIIDYLRNKFCSNLDYKAKTIIFILKILKP